MKFTDYKFVGDCGHHFFSPYALFNIKLFCHFHETEVNIEIVDFTQQIDILRKIAVDYLNDEYDIDYFWMLIGNFILCSRPNTNSDKLAYDIENEIDEYHRYHITENELRWKVRCLVEKSLYI